MKLWSQVPAEIDSTQQSSVVAYAMNTGSVLYNRTEQCSGLEWPRGSGHYFVFGAGLWIGARAESNGSSDSIVFVSYNMNSGASWANPLTPVVHAYGANHESMTWSFDDHDLERYEGSAANRAKQGYPLGVRVEQEMIAWTSGPYTNSLLIRSTVTNTSPTAALKDLVVGMAMDLGTESTDHVHLGIVQEEPTPILRAHDTNDRSRGSMGIAFIDAYGDAKLVSCAMWPIWIENVDHDRYTFLTWGRLDTSTTFAGSGSRPILAAAPIELEPNTSTTIALLLTFDGEVSDAADQRIKALVDGFDINTTVSEFDKSSTSWIYPNPTNGAQWVQVNSDASAGAITIIDLLGVPRIVGVPLNNAINISDLESGMYCVLITSAHEVHQHTLIITK